MYDFNLLGHCMSYISKLKKHQGHPRRLVDYILSGYTTFDPNNVVKHPCWEHISNAMEICKKKAGDLGLQNGRI